MAGPNPESGGDESGPSTQSGRSGGSGTSGTSDDSIGRFEDDVSGEECLFRRGWPSPWSSERLRGGGLAAVCWSGRALSSRSTRSFMISNSICSVSTLLARFPILTMLLVRILSSCEGNEEGASEEVLERSWSIRFRSWARSPRIAASSLDCSFINAPPPPREALRAATSRLTCCSSALSADTSPWIWDVLLSKSRRTSGSVAAVFWAICFTSLSSASTEDRSSWRPLSSC